MVQRVEDALTVDVYETNARLAIHEASHIWIIPFTWVPTQIYFRIRLCYAMDTGRCS